MNYFLIRFLIGGLVVAGATTLTKTNNWISSLIVVLPFVSTTTSILMYLDGASIERIQTFWIKNTLFGIPLFVFFLIAYYTLGKTQSFWISTGAAVASMLVFFIPYVYILKKFNLPLFN